MNPPGGGRREVLGGVHLAWVRLDELPSGVGWLGPGERAVVEGLRVEKRRDDWLTGRWAARQAVWGVLGENVPGLEIIAADDGRPEVRFHPETGAWPRVTLSISHTGAVAVAAAAAGSIPLGVDVEVVAERTDDFVNDYFTPAERAAVARCPTPDRALLTNLIWSAKESALKAMGEGLRKDTRSVSVEVGDARGGSETWAPLTVAGEEGRVFVGHWRVRAGLVQTLVTEAAR